ncbi:hypothetical protein L1987_01814 [Smallanthus sonchifolius]|uniref:Uncharacterized protein n=1 Tax=Smallanthus sonchifolius TaxID=185202 RepID=A0ACB9K5Z7_9ASTR|nr:hypothetical protein L1987_01814 [Smallanthus sonchifolius]
MCMNKKNKFQGLKAIEKFGEFAGADDEPVHVPVQEPVVHVQQPRVEQEQKRVKTSHSNQAPQQQQQIPSASQEDIDVIDQYLNTPPELKSKDKGEATTYTSNIPKDEEEKEDDDNDDDDGDDGGYDGGDEKKDDDNNDGDDNDKTFDDMFDFLDLELRNEEKAMVMYTGGKGSSRSHAHTVVFDGNEDELQFDVEDDIDVGLEFQENVFGDLFNTEEQSKGLDQVKTVEAEVVELDSELEQLFDDIDDDVNLPN